MSAYACEPNRGSEPGVGWNLSHELAKVHDVCVVTRANNRPAIEAAESQGPPSGIRWVYYDLPDWAKWWKRGGRGVQLYYYLWQVGAGITARRVAAETPFDIVHHITFVKYWTPSFMSRCAPVFVWGPVGGGEHTPPAFKTHYRFGGRVYEALRDLARYLARHDPALKRTARDAAMALVTTEATGRQVRALGARAVQQLWDVGLTAEEFEMLGTGQVSVHPPRFLSVGRLVHLKAFDLGLRAFAQAQIADSEFWIVGDGAERRRLEDLCSELGIADRVHFLGALPRDRALEAMKHCSALVHPSLHESGGWVCVEAMAAGRPVICLDTGGPATQVTEETGFVVTVESVDAAIEGIRHAMVALADPEECGRLGAGGRKRAELFLWKSRVDRLDALYRKLSGVPAS